MRVAAGVCAARCDRPRPKRHCHCHGCASVTGRPSSPRASCTARGRSRLFCSTSGRSCPESATGWRTRPCAHPSGAQSRCRCGGGCVAYVVLPQRVSLVARRMDSCEHSMRAHAVPISTWRPRLRRRMSHLACRTSHVARQRRMSHGTCRMPHFARCTTHVAFCTLHVAWCTLHAVTWCMLRAVTCCMLRAASCSTVHDTPSIYITHHADCRYAAKIHPETTAAALDKAQIADLRHRPRT
jgi:hypothetical protein